jgi:hypothetical protein
MTPFEFWAIVIIGGSAVSVMLMVALRMIWQWRASSVPSHHPQERGKP